MLSRLDAEVEDYANEIVISNAAMAKIGQDTKTLSEWLKGVVPRAIKWSTSLHWAEEGEQRAAQAWAVLKELIGKFSSS